MGTPLPPNEPGNDCNNCFGPGKTFGDVTTPHVIQLRLTSLLPGQHYTPEWEQFLLTTHYLEQSVDPCQYRIDSNDFRFDVIWGVFNSAVQVVYLPRAWQVFDAPAAELCVIDVPNNLQTAPGTIMYAGFANITWDLEGLT